jgi:amino acid adenylation domain-containing protein
VYAILAIGEGFTVSGSPDSTAELRLADWFGRGLHVSADGVALRIGSREWTYAELHDVALRLGGAMYAAAGGPPEAVGVLAARSLECYAGILAGAYAGAAVVPLSPSFPVARTTAMARAAGVRTIVADQQGMRLVPDLASALPEMAIVQLDPGLTSTAGIRTVVATEAGALDTPVGGKPDDVAYVLFTSGSTGRPKGVPVTHRNMAHFLRTNLARYQLVPHDVCSQTFDCTFDLAMFDLFVTWAAGALVVSTPAQAFWALPDFVAKHGMTFWFSVPSAISLVQRRGGLSPGSLPTLRWSLFCGEPLTLEDATRWQRAASGSVLENLYGPTELTIACSVYRWDQGTSPTACVNGVVPIGLMYPEMSALLIDGEGQVTDLSGELCVSGPQMFPGYLDRRDDATRFITVSGQRWYRTGDLVRTCGEAGFAYLGRVDHQVKIRGYRLDMAELEWHARSVTGVDAAVLVTVTDPSSRRLFAWFTGDPGAATRILEKLRVTVPEYMVPHWIKHVPELPLNANRKIDRGALAAMAQRLVDGPVAGSNRA